MMKIMNPAGETGLLFACDHFAEGEFLDSPFLVFLFPGSDNFYADGQVYFRISVLHFERYTDAKAPDVEARVEAVLDAHGIFYNKSEVWMETERLYEVFYDMEVARNEKNRIKYNLKNVYATILTKGSDGSFTYGTPQAIPRAVSMSLDAEGEASPFYADGIVYFRSQTNNGYSGDLEIALIPEWLREDVLKEKLDSNRSVDGKRQ